MRHGVEWYWKKGIRFRTREDSPTGFLDLLVFDSTVQKGVETLEQEEGYVITNGTELYAHVGEVINQAPTFAARIFAEERDARGALAQLQNAGQYRRYKVELITSALIGKIIDNRKNDLYRQ